jgi:hypothetical protein
MFVVIIMQKFPKLLMVCKKTGISATTKPINAGFTSMQFVNDSVGFAIGGNAGGPLFQQVQLL